MYIAIAGNIGAGKTTLTKMLAKYYGWEPRFESVSFNPYLEDYYGDIKRWAFCLETYFLKERFKDMLLLQKAGHTIVQDRSILRVCMSSCAITTSAAIFLNVISRPSWNFLIS